MWSYCVFPADGDRIARRTTIWTDCRTIALVNGLLVSSCNTKGVRVGASNEEEDVDVVRYS